MSKISIVDLEVFYRVGVPDGERAQPQRLLLAIEMESDFSAAAKSDGIADTIDYFAVSQRLLKFGDGRSWKLIEKLAADIAGMILSEFKPESVTVEIKKFPIPLARHVSVILTKKRS
jgi:7,8-dihydroneopterin aldolase/epimerase/oxygenase